ncbi:MAG TPA: threonine/serine exporter family protein [Planctomycetota bacterium]
MQSDAEAFVLELVQALHRHGLPAYRIEDALQRVGKRLGLELNVFTVPTGLTLGIGPLASQHVRLLRVQPGSIHLGRTHALAELIEDIDAGRLDVAGARARLTEIERQPHLHGPLALVAAFALASAASAVFFGARAAEVAVSGAIGAVVGMLASGAERHVRLARLFEVLAAAAAAFVAGLVTAVLPGLERESVVLASIIVLLPGYTLTVAMNELAARHYSSGTARLGGVLATMFLLACGAAAGTAGADATLALLPAAGPAEALAPLPTWGLWLALFLSPLAFKVLFQARDRDAPWIVGAAWVAFLGARAGSAWLGPLLGAGCGAFVLGLASNALARLRLRPSSITTVPGLLVLVPGSLGFRGVSSFLAEDSLPGVELVARMLAVAMALVSGLLLAGVVVPSQRTL